MNTLQPTTEKDRLLHIDVIRGFAIFGILLVNMAHFSYPDLYLLPIGEHNFFTENWSQWDQWTRTLLDIFIEMKFITMFSFLFGFGMYLLLERTEAKGYNFTALYTRRLFVLLIFGTIHAFLIWDGDILTEYALLGFVLLLFRKHKPKTILIWAMIFYTLIAIPFLLISIVPDDMAVDMSEYSKQMKLEGELEAKQALQTYSEGSFVEVIKQNIHDRVYYMKMNGMASFNPLLYFYVNIPFFSMFLLGLYIAKKRFLHNLSQHKKTLLKIWLVGLIIGLPTNIIYGLNGNEAMLIIGAPFLMMFYVITIIYLMRCSWNKRLFTAVAAVGRTAFSNYILQSIMMTTIFYSYGFGLYGKVYPLVGLAIASGFFILQLIISSLWLRHFAYGPLEWVWRAATYKGVSTFKKK